MALDQAQAKALELVLEQARAQVRALEKAQDLVQEQAREQVQALGLALVKAQAVVKALAEVRVLAQVTELDLWEPGPLVEL
jgi:hypothetical protein